MKNELDHVLRPPLPWRMDEGLTECGRDSKNLQVLTNEAFIDRCKELGKTRTAMITCMTCLQTVQTWLHNQDSLISIVGREIDRSGRKYSHPDGDFNQLENEFRAIALLVEAHREEFDQAIDAMANATSMDQLRAARNAKRRNAQ